MLYEDPNVPSRPVEEDPVPPIQQQEGQPDVTESDPNHDPVYQDKEQDVDTTKESFVDRVKGFFDSLREDRKPADNAE